MDELIVSEEEETEQRSGTETCMPRKKCTAL